MLLLFTLILYTLLFTSMLLLEGNFVAMGKIAKPGCQTHCGDIPVPYPFGFGNKSCFLDESFELTCNSTFTPPKLFTGNVQVLQITNQSEMRIFNSVAFRCYQAGKITSEVAGWTTMGSFPFTFSQKNIFTVVGCDDFAVITNEAQFTSGCLGMCSETNYASGQCPGVGCCQTSIPKGLKYFNATLLSFENHTKVESFNRCGFAFLGEEHSFQFRGASDFSDAMDFWERTRANVPIVVDWVIGGGRNCKQATECKENSFCEDEDTGGYRCICNEGYQGNPYLDPGCQAKPADCQTQCGNLTVQYPFGIGTGCSLDESFQLTCDDTHVPPQLSIGSGEINIHSISESEMRIFNSVSYTCYDESGRVTQNSSGRINLKNTPFSFSQKNQFTVIGCDDFAVITREYGADFTSGCLGLCSKNDKMPNGTCSEVYGCCQTSIPKGLKYYYAKFFSLNNHTSVQSFNPCGFAFLGEKQGYQFGGTNDSSNPAEFYKKAYSVPIVVDWVVGGTRTCSQATECKGNSNCKDDADTGGYRCSCNDGYQGNPYLEPGCQDINECLDKKKLPCYGDCINTPGSYNCTCPRGYTGDAKMADGCTHAGKGSAALAISLALLSGLVAILGGIGVSFVIRKRKLFKLREKFFEQNGGVFLKQKLKAPGVNDAVTMFSTEELRKATDNYSEERIVGRGGYGVVYKGFLPDKRVVAIKKSKLVDGTQAEQFINEIWILTQVIHRNVVKLLGCCLEEEVPVLVYEFISNNTLFYHIHQISGGMSWLSWENRLRVAAEAACALAYLHSQATMPIIHRDVKSANILLDENYTTKISDFGASRLVPIDHDQVTTLVQGTLGYLDPEYFHTSQLNEKSDVYSFGMVLAELITGRKPICAGKTNEEKNLATYFVKSMKENRLFQIVEPRLLREATLEQLQTVAELVKRCLNLLGEDRPTMRDVAMELEGLRKFTTHPWVPLQIPEESRSLTLEVEQSDLYDVPLIPYSSNEWESYSGITETTIQEYKPR